MGRAMRTPNEGCDREKGRAENPRLQEIKQTMLTAYDVVEAIEGDE